MLKSIVTAAAFSLVYVSMYPMLTCGFLFYFYPYWPPPLAATYVVCGILLQAWFCLERPAPATRRPLWPQIAAGIGYLVAAVMLSGGFYQS